MSIERAFSDLLAELSSPASRRTYTNMWKQFSLWLDAQGVAPLDVRPRQISAYLAHLRTERKSKATLQLSLSVIREAYRFFVREELLASNPAREVKSPRVESTPKTPYLSEDDAKKLLAVPAQSWEERRDRLCVRLLLGLGWRRAEVARIRVEDIHEGMVTGTVKGGKTITVGIPAWLQRDIAEWREDTDIDAGPLLPRGPDDPRPMSDDMVYQHVVRLARRAGVTINPHGLRRTNITLTGARGVSLKERQLAVGHSNSGTTERYDRARDASANAPGQVLEDLTTEEKK